MALGLPSFASLFKAKSSASLQSGLLGIDIGSSAIKIVQLRDVKGVPTLETYGELQLGPYEGIDLGRSTHLPAQKMIEALVDILREAGATGKDAAFALSYNSSFTATIPIPTLDMERIPAMIPIEARKYIPIALSKVSLDWSPISVHEENKITNVLISAIFNEVLDEHNTIMSGSGLTTLVSEIEIFSSIRAALSPKDETVAIIDCGAGATRLYIVRNGSVGKTHSVLLSGVTLTQALSETLGVEFREAEVIKRTVGLLGKENDSRIQKTLGTGLERGLREMHTVIKRYEESERSTVDTVILSGSGALLQGLPQYIQDMFSKPVRIADPFSKVAYPVFLEDTLKVAGPSFSVAVGVALRAFQKT